MLRGLLCFLVLGLWTTILFPVFCLMMLVSWNPSAAMWGVRHLWAPVLLWVAGTRLEVEGLEGVDFSRPHIFVSNHLSTLDIPVLFVALPVNFRFVAKKILMYAPVLGWFMYLSRFIFIDRSNSKEAVASLDEAARRIRGGISILMFAEGTRSGSMKVLPFKRGPFTLAVKARVPVVPLAVENSGRLMPKNAWAVHPGTVRVRLGKPIDPLPFGDDRDALKDAVRDQVVALYAAMGGPGAEDEPRRREGPRHRPQPGGQPEAAR